MFSITEPLLQVKLAAVAIGVLYFVVDSIRDYRYDRYMIDYNGPVTRMYFNEETGRLEVKKEA